MSNFTLDDRHRSLREYLAMALGSPPWVARTEREVISDDQRPAVVVETSSPVGTIFARATVPQGDVRKMQGFSIMAYPEIKATARESKAEAERVAQLLDDLFTLGMEAGDDAPEPQAPIGWPLRVPVWDWDDVPVSGATRGDRPEDPYGYGNVDNLFVRPIQDPVDHLRYTVVCDLRLRWWQSGRIPPDAPLTESIHPTFAP